LVVLEQAFTVEQMLNAQEVFLTSTTQEVLPLTQIDGRPIAQGRAGPVTLRLREAFRNLVLAKS